MQSRPGARGGMGADPAAVESAASTLALAQERYRVLTESMKDVVWILDVESLRFRYVSPSVTALRGWTPEEIMAAPMDAALTPVEAAALRAGVAEDIRLLRAGERAYGEFITREVEQPCKDGGTVWTEVIGQYRLDETTGRIEFWAVTRDISARRAAEQALAESEERYRILAENASDVVYRLSADGVIEWASPGAQPSLGWQAADVVGRGIADVTYPPDIPTVTAALAAVLRGEPQRLRLRLRTSSGGFRWADLTARPVRDADGAVVAVVGGWRDVQAEVEALEGLAASEEHYRLLAEYSSDVVLRLGLDDRIAWSSPASVRVLGWRPEDLAGRDVTDLVHPDDAAACRAHFASVSEPGAARAMTVRARRSDGAVRWIEVASQVAAPEGGAAAFRVSRLRDVDAEVRTYGELARSEERFRTAMEGAPVGMAVVDLDLRFEQVNAAIAEMLGRSPDWLLSHAVTDVIDPADRELDAWMRGELRSAARRTVTREKRLVRADGATVWVQHVIGLIHDADGRPVSYVSQFLDVTENRNARRQLQFLADHDPLTDLVNRRAVLTRMAAVLSHPPRTGTRLGVLYCDLDGLKPINDTWGHAAGDHVLVEVSRRINRSVRSADTVGRQGGDEFVVLLSMVGDLEDARRVADSVRRAVAEPIRLEDREVRVTVSVGVTVADPLEDPDTVLRRADQALYAAKQQGGDVVMAVASAGR